MFACACGTCQAKTLTELPGSDVEDDGVDWGSHPSVRPLAMRDATGVECCCVRGAVQPRNVCLVIVVMFDVHAFRFIVWVDECISFVLVWYTIWMMSAFFHRFLLCSGFSIADRAS